MLLASSVGEADGVKVVLDVVPSGQDGPAMGCFDEKGSMVWLRLHWEKSLGCRRSLLREALH